MPYRVARSRLLLPRTAHEVRREPLLQTLHQGFQHSPVLVLAAGAGYGKSTLLASYGGLWLGLGPDCGDPVVLGWHLLEVYRQRIPNPAEVALALESGAWVRASEALLEGVSSLPPHTLVLDDAQWAAGRESLTGLRILSRAPGLRLAILSRRAAPWEILGRVLGESDLAFGPGEALLLARAVAPQLPAFAVEQAHSLVRGWPLGLRLMLRAMQRGARPEGALYAHPDPTSLLAYLLPALPPQIQREAARASVLGETDDPLLVAYAEDLLLERVGHRWRFHPLVRQALISLLDPAEVRSLLSGAAEAALQRGEGVVAAGYLLEAGRLGHAADLLTERGARWLASGLTYTVLGLLERLPAAVRETRRGLLLLEAEALRQAGRYPEAEALYQQARQAGITQAVLGLAQLYLDTVEPARAWPYLEEARPLFPQAAQLWAENLLNAGRVSEAVAAGLQGPRVLLRSGQPAQALEEVRRSHWPQGLRPPQNHREGTLLLALLEAVAGRAEAAEAAALQARREGELLASPFVLALAESRLGHAYLAQNRWDEAQLAYERALELADGGPARLRQEALGGLAALGQPGSLAQMVQIARQAGDPWVESFMVMAAAMAHLRRGEAFGLPTLTVEDPFLQTLAQTYPWQGGQATLQRYPFLAQPTLFAPPPATSRRLLWQMGQLDLAYHPGVTVEIRALGGLEVRVNQQLVRLKREKVRLLLALLLVRDWRKEALIEALGGSDGEFRVLWSELLGTLEPGRPARAPGYFLRPHALVRQPELRVDLWNPIPLAGIPCEGLDHPWLEVLRHEYGQKRRSHLLAQPLPQAWLEALRLDPLDETILERLANTPLAQEARNLHQRALHDLSLEN